MGARRPPCSACSRGRWQRPGDIEHQGSTSSLGSVLKHGGAFAPFPPPLAPCLPTKHMRCGGWAAAHLVQGVAGRRVAAGPLEHLLLGAPRNLLAAVRGPAVRLCTCGARGRRVHDRSGQGGRGRRLCWGLVVGAGWARPAACGRAGGGLGPGVYAHLGPLSAGPGCLPPPPPGRSPRPAGWPSRPPRAWGVPAVQRMREPMATERLGRCCRAVLQRLCPHRPARAQAPVLARSPRCVPPPSCAPASPGRRHSSGWMLPSVAGWGGAGRRMCPPPAAGSRARAPVGAAWRCLPCGIRSRRRLSVPHPWRACACPT
jgi:hypothetical protein